MEYRIKEEYKKLVDKKLRNLTYKKKGNHFEGIEEPLILSNFTDEIMEVEWVVLYSEYNITTNEPVLECYKSSKEPWTEEDLDKIEKILNGYLTVPKDFFIKFAGFLFKNFNEKTKAIDLFESIELYLEENYIK